MVRIASFNVENLFARPKGFRAINPDVGTAIVGAYEEVNGLFKEQPYTAADKAKIKPLLVVLDIYQINQHGAVRRILSVGPRWAWLRKNRGSFDRQPEDQTKRCRDHRHGPGQLDRLGGTGQGSHR